AARSASARARCTDRSNACSPTVSSKSARVAIPTPTCAAATTASPGTGAKSRSKNRRGCRPCCGTRVPSGWCRRPSDQRCALAIGANTAIFTVVNAVVLQPLPFDHPDRLVQVNEKNDALNLANFGASVLNYLSWKEQARSLDLAAVGFGTYSLSGQGEPEQF